jgi:hypothetical protein
MLLDRANDLLVGVSLLLHVEISSLLD